MKNLILAAIVAFSFSSVFTGCVSVPGGGGEEKVRNSPPKKTAVDRAQEYQRRGHRVR